MSAAVSVVDTPIGPYCQTHQVYDCTDRGPCSPDPAVAACDDRPDTRGRSYCHAHRTRHPVS